MSGRRRRPMTAAEHYTAARRHLDDARASTNPVPTSNHLVAAQVHATLALYRAWTAADTNPLPDVAEHDPWAGSDQAPEMTP